MCMCGAPTINGQPGYSWNGEAKHIRPLDPPPLGDGDTLLYDEPGRCGGVDSHSYHLRLVKARIGGFKLLVQHGGGSERIDLGYSLRMAIDAFANLDSNARYWLLMLLYHTQDTAATKAATTANAYWRKAAAEGRIKTRKVRGRPLVNVTVEPETATA